MNPLSVPFAGRGRRRLAGLVALLLVGSAAALFSRSQAPTVAYAISADPVISTASSDHAPSAGSPGAGAVGQAALMPGWVS